MRGASLQNGEILSEWNSTPEKPRVAKIKEILAGQGLIYKSPVIVAVDLIKRRHMLGQIRSAWRSSNIMHLMLSRETESRPGKIIDYLLEKLSMISFTRKSVTTHVIRFQNTGACFMIASH